MTHLLLNPLIILIIAIFVLGGIWELQSWKATHKLCMNCKTALGNGYSYKKVVRGCYHCREIVKLKS